MRVREIHEAHQWSPANPHPAVATTVLESGMAPSLHPGIADHLRSGKGAVGAIQTFDTRGDFQWEIVWAGDWIIDRNGSYELVRQRDFSVRFEAV